MKEIDPSDGRAWHRCVHARPPGDTSVSQVFPSIQSIQGEHIATQTADETITLYFRRGSSDKIYHASIEPSGPGYIVTFAYGRRGSTLATGTKTNVPVGFEEAKKIYDKLVKEKTTKGYTPGEDGTPYQHTEKSDRSTGIVPQLLNAIDEADAQKFITDAEYWAQEKFDGRRVLIRRVGDTITGINRLGLAIDLPNSIVNCARQMGSQQWLIDGEAVGDTLFAFDVLESACIDLRSQPYVKRVRALPGIVGDDAGAPIRVVETATSTTAKQAMLERLRERRAEGIVFKRHLAPHSAGRPASGGDWLKLKFTAMASCIVAGANGSKRSVSIELIDGDHRVGVGNVTIPPNHPIPVAGQIIEVRYLYGYPGGSLYQPVYLCRRDDVTLGACTTAQVKLKAKDIGDGEEA